MLRDWAPQRQVGVTAPGRRVPGAALDRDDGGRGGVAAVTSQVAARSRPGWSGRSGSGGRAGRARTRSGRAREPAGQCARMIAGGGATSGASSIGTMVRGRDGAPRLGPAPRPTPFAGNVQTDPKLPLISHPYSSGMEPTPNDQPGRMVAARRRAALGKGALAAVAVAVFAGRDACDPQHRIRPLPALGNTADGPPAVRQHGAAELRCSRAPSLRPSRRPLRRAPASRERAPPAIPCDGLRRARGRGDGRGGAADPRPVRSPRAPLQPLRRRQRTERGERRRRPGDPRVPHVRRHAGAVAMGRPRRPAGWSTPRSAPPCARRATTATSRTASTGRSRPHRRSQVAGIGSRRATSCCACPPESSSI